MGLSGISRRRVLAAGAGLIGGTPSLALAQGVARIERLSPGLDRVLVDTQPIKRLAEGFGGPLGAVEGPLWWPEGGYLLFSDIQNDRRLRYQPGAGVSVDKQGVNRHNGLTRDTKGRLVACERDTRRVVRFEPDGETTVIASSYQSHRLSRPNDVIVKADGAIYFSDPLRPDVPDAWDVQSAGLYRVAADLGSITLLRGDFVMPNGLAFSPDEKYLYVNDTLRRHIRRIELAPQGALLPAGGLLGQTDTVFFIFSGSERGTIDGMKVDVAGNVYCGGPGGLWILDPQGVALGRIVHGEPATSNMAFGGPELKTLYFTSRTHLGSVELKISGCPVPARAPPPEAS